MIKIIEWNPWSGCLQCSYDCAGCYVLKNRNEKFKVNLDELDLPMQLLDATNVQNPMRLMFDSDSVFNVCTYSDFFINAADNIRGRIWRIIKARYDCIFLIETKRVKSIKERLPSDWGDGWNNVILVISASHKESLEKQLVFAKEVPLKHVFIALTPLKEEIDLTTLDLPKSVEMVISGGDYYDDINIFNWHKKLSIDAKKLNLGYIFKDTGKRLMLGDKVYIIPEDKRTTQAYKAQLNRSKVVDRNQYLDKPLILNGIEWVIQENRFVPKRWNQETKDCEIDYDMFFKSNQILEFSPF